MALFRVRWNESVQSSNEVHRIVIGSIIHCIGRQFTPADCTDWLYNFCLPSIWHTRLHIQIPRLTHICRCKILVDIHIICVCLCMMMLCSYICTQKTRRKWAHQCLAQSHKTFTLWGDWVWSSVRRLIKTFGLDEDGVSYSDDIYSKSYALNCGGVLYR